MTYEHYIIPVQILTGHQNAFRARCKSIFQNREQRQIRKSKTYYCMQILGHLGYTRVDYSLGQVSRHGQDPGQQHHRSCPRCSPRQYRGRRRSGLHARYPSRNILRPSAELSTYVVKYISLLIMKCFTLYSAHILPSSFADRTVAPEADNNRF